MVAQPLLLPPADFIDLKLKPVALDPARLFRVSPFNTGEPYFGSSGANRFDAPGAPGHPEYLACYLGQTLTVALAETLLHDEVPLAGKFQIATAELRRRYEIRFEGSLLNLADLTGASLKRMGAHAELSGTADYSLTRQWALAVHQNHSHVDGFMYMSRHMNTQKAVVLFDRAKHKIRMLTATELVRANGFAHAAKRLGLVGI